MSNRPGLTTKITERTTIAATLADARFNRGLTLTDVARATHIPERYLRLFEETPAHTIPDDAYTRIYLKAYATFLNLEPSTLSARLKEAREFAVTHTQTSTTKRRVNKTPTSTNQPHTTSASRHPTTGVATGALISIPRLLRHVGFGLIACGVFAYLGLSLASSFAPPRLVVLSPGDNDAIRGGRVGVMGTTAPEVTIEINGQTTPVDSQGNWSDVIELQQGKNDITITATKKYGKPTTIHRTVIAE